MVREGIHVKEAQCGNNVGVAIVQAGFAEHDLAVGEKKGNFKYKAPAGDASDADGDGLPDTLEKIDVYFRATSDEPTTCQYVPRAVLVDL
jgi:hypothetical protein